MSWFVTLLVWVWGALALISGGYKAMKENSFKYTKKDFEKYKKMGVNKEL